MPNKDFENFEAKLVKLREEAHESLDAAEKLFDETYLARLEEIFPRDILWAKKLIRWSFLINYVDSVHVGKSVDSKKIFNQSVASVIHSLPLSTEKKSRLEKNIVSASNLSQSLQSYFTVGDDISRDPFFALVEDFSMDGDISKEEFLLLQQSYESGWDFLKALERLPESTKTMFHAHIELNLNQDHAVKKWAFEWEYSQELKVLESRGINIEPVVAFVSRSYYKTPGKYKKYEHPKRRMRRTFKIALLKILRAKLWNINAQILLDRFEAGESFDDFFMILFQLLEVINEDPNGEEIYSILKLDEELQDVVFSAEENKQKILAGESLVMKIASLFSKSHTEWEETELDEGLLEKVLDENTDIVGDELYFNRPEDDNAWIFAESESETQEDDEEELDYNSLSPEVAYEMLEHKFHKIEEEKRKAFLEWNYDEIDVYNDQLLDIESKLTKLCKILWREI